MNEPHWLNQEIILAIHTQLLARFGGLEGLRDEGLLESALARPNQLISFGAPSLFDMAAAYAHGIAKNKRAAFMAAYTFLGINGFRLDAPEEQAVLQTLALAAGEIDANEFSAWLKASCIAT